MRGEGAPRSDDATARHKRGIAHRATTFGGPNSLGINPASEAISRRMSRTRRRDTSPEVKLRRELHASGLRFRVDKAVLSGVRRRPDIVFGPAKVAVFIDGCFWHGCPKHGTWPKHNAEFWRTKIQANQHRDRDTDQRLSEAGWEVVRVWEHEDPRVAATAIEKLVRVRRRAGTLRDPR